MSDPHHTECIPTLTLPLMPLVVANHRRCLSSKELGTLAPPSGSPYAYMLYEKERLENSMRQRLLTMRETLPPSDKVGTDSEAELETSSKTSATAAPRVVGANQLRNHRRAQHNQAVVEDLVSVVSDLFIAESKLLKPLQYGVPQQSEHCREQISRCIHQFVSCLPMRYALGADTPSEVLLHMRLMTAARADRTKAVVHIHNMQNEDNWTRTAVSASKNHHRELRLVTICCNDANGLLEYITKLLATGGSRVLDADVMLSTDGVVLVSKTESLVCLHISAVSAIICSHHVSFYAERTDLSLR
jgi:hypothetical protein